MAKRDVGALRRNFSISDVARSFGVDLKRDGDEWSALCPFHNEDTPSFTVFVGDDGADRFHCFGCGEHGDVLDFVQRIKGVDLKEAIKILGGEIDVANVERRQIKPRSAYEGIEPLAPASEITVGEWVELYNPKRERWGKFHVEAAYPYRSADGLLTGYVLRRSLKEGGKETPMVMWVRLPDGKECWSRYPMPKPRPLYNGHKAVKARQVIIVEGEKCADALTAATGRCVVTWPGGTNGVDHADWSPLAGKDVVIWPDADKEGHGAALRIAELLDGKASRIRIVNVSDRSGGWDCADAIADGWSKEKVETFMRERVSAVPATAPQESAPEPEPAPAPAPETAPEAAPVRDVRPFTPSGTPVEFYNGLCTERYPDFIPTGTSGLKLRDHPMRDQIIELREWVFLAFDKEFYNIRTRERISRESFNLAKARLVPEIEVEIPGSTDFKVKVPKPDVALVSHLSGEVVYSTMYAPHLYEEGRPFNPFFQVDGVWYVNSFSPDDLPNTDPNWRDHHAWRDIQEYFDKVYGANAKYLIQWIAYNVRFPGRKILWAPILVGVEGAGKSTVADITRAALGARNVLEIFSTSISSPFNAWAEGACVRVLEEIRIPGESRYEAMNKLKPAITNQRIEIVAKGKDGREVLNVTNYIAMSNHDDALPLTENDRRWSVFRAKFKSREHMLAETGDEWWSRVHAAYRDHPEVIRGWLLDGVDLSDFNPRIAPDTGEAKALMIEAARSHAEADVMEAIALGGEGVSETVLATDCLNARVKEMGGRTLSTTTLANILRGLGWTKFEGRVKWKGAARRVYYQAGMLPDGMSDSALLAYLRNALDAAGKDEPAQETDPMPW